MHEDDTQTISLTHGQNNWFKEQIDAGHYVDDSEYIRYRVDASRYL